MDLDTRRVLRAGRAIELKPDEFRMLEQLLRHKDQVVTRGMLLETVWNYRFDPAQQPDRYACFAAAPQDR